MSEQKYKEFVEYFNELDRRGISFGITDLFKKSRELGLPPCPDIVKMMREVNKIAD
jgi:hypothetical protein